MTTEFRAELDLFSEFAAPQRCPGCHERGLQAVSVGGQTVFRCPSCHGCWHVELGWISPVDPEQCADFESGSGDISRPANTR
jgi:hypothetical protein